jgi:hypothetical protein
MRALELPNFLGILVCQPGYEDRVSAIEAQLSRRRPCFVEDQAVHVEGQIGERDFRLGALDADGADEQAHFRLLMRKDMLDPGAHAGFGRVAAPDIGGIGLPLGFLR